MSKINLTDLSTITGNETSAINIINNNSSLIETFSDNTLSRDGSTPNQMLSDLDMNSNRVINLPVPTSAEEPLRLQDLSDFIGTGIITAGAPTNASYLTLGTNATLSNERVLTAGTNISFVDGGAGSTLTVNVPTNAPTTASYLTLGVNSTLTNERVLTAGTGISLTDGGANSTLTVATNTNLNISYIFAKDFGAVGNGIADDTTALQSWITSGLSTGKVCVLNPGTYKITTALSITGQLTIIGAGASISIIQPATTINGINISTTLPVTLEKLGVFYPSAAASSTYAIQVTGTGNGNSSSVFRDIQLLNCYTGINFIAATAFVVDNAKIELFSSTGITVQNTGNVDAGDSTISNCFILGTGGPLAGIQWTSEGALHVINNNILSVQYGFAGQLVSAAITRQMFITGNTFDGCTVAGVSFNRLGVTGTFGGVNIANNVFNLCKIGVSVPADANGAWLTGLNIIGNNYYDNGTASSFFVNLNSITSFVIGYNTSQSTVATTVNILTAASTTSGVVGPNVKTGTFAANSIAGTSITTIAPN